MKKTESQSKNCRTRRSERGKNRSPNLTEHTVAAIVEQITNWTGRLTWPALIDSVKSTLGIQYVRQTLHNNGSIRATFDAYKERTSRSGTADNKVEIHKQCVSGAGLEYQKLQLQIASLKRERELLLERFVRWSYNASTRGLSSDFLDRPLPEIDRSRER